MVQKIERNSKKLGFLQAIEESNVRQKSCIYWLKGRDLNNSYFHLVWKMRMTINSICFLLLRSGDLSNDPISMGIITINHFQSILWLANCSTTISTPNWFHNLTDFLCSNSHAGMLLLWHPSPLLKTSRRLSLSLTLIRPWARMALRLVSSKLLGDLLVHKSPLLSFNFSEWVLFLLV